LQHHRPQNCQESLPSLLIGARLTKLDARDHVTSCDVRMCM